MCYKKCINFSEQILRLKNLSLSEKVLKSNKNKSAFEYRERFSPSKTYRLWINKKKKCQTSATIFLYSEGSETRFVITWIEWETRFQVWWIIKIHLLPFWHNNNKQKCVDDWVSGLHTYRWLLHKSDLHIFFIDALSNAYRCL